MHRLPKFTIGSAAAFLTVIAGVLLYLFEPLALQVIRNAAFDQYQRWQPRAYDGKVPVRIVDVDDESLTRMGQWPWPRTVVAQLIEKLQDSGAAAIGFDVVFAEEDRTSPKAMAATWGVSGDLRERLLRNPDHDEVMRKAMAKGGVVLGFAAERKDAKTRLPAQPYRVVNSGGEPALPYLHKFGGAVTSIELLDSTAAGVGALTFVPDPDGVVRRVPLLINVRDQVMPSLTAESLRVGLKQKNFVVRTAAQKGAGIQDVRIGGTIVPASKEGEMWVHYTRPAKERYIPAWQVFEGRADKEKLEGHVVLIGTSAQGLMDLRFNPMGSIMPGVEAHAQALEQILTGIHLERPTWASAIEVLVLITGGILVGVIALTTRAFVSAGLTAVILAGVGLAAWWAFRQHGLLLDPVTPGLMLLIAFIFGSVIQHVNSEREQRWVRDAFSRYVSPNRVEYLVNNPGDLELGGRRQECSFVFTDLESFTTLIESIGPGPAVALLNDYLDRMVAIAFEAGGTLDRIVGDAVAIMFSAPVQQPDHRERAFKCALAMHQFASQYVADLSAQGKHFGRTRVGVHSGEVIVGNFGGSTMFDYRALGDAVNTSSRLEGANKHLGTTVCVSEETLSGCPGVIARPIGQLVVKGKTKALAVFDPLEMASGPALKQRDVEYDAAYALMKQGDTDAALAAFEQLAQARPGDGLVAFHVQRVREGAADDFIKLDEK